MIADWHRLRQNYGEQRWVEYVMSGIRSVGSGSADTNTVHIS